jgi:hypothetical protein
LSDSNREELGAGNAGNEQRRVKQQQQSSAHEVGGSAGVHGAAIGLVQGQFAREFEIRTACPRNRLLKLRGEGRPSRKHVRNITRPPDARSFCLLVC